MAKLFKLTTYIVDPNGEFYDSSDLEECLIYDTQKHFCLHHLKINEADLGEWDDDLPINKFNCPEAEFEKYFKENTK